jgi:hypothetical protein
MTIKLREHLFRGFFALSVAMTLTSFLTLWFVGAEGIEHARTSGLGNADPRVFYTVLAAACASGLYALTVSAFLAMRSGKTVSVELFFFALWALCQAFELTKIVSVAFGTMGAGSGVYELATRAALAGRYCGAIAVFSGSLFAVGLKQERGIPILMVTLVSALLFASMHPLNSVGPGKDFLADRGIEPLTGALELSLTMLATVNYLIAWRAGKDRAYVWTCVGLVLCVAASAVLKTIPNPIVASASIPVLVFGTWLHIKSLHDYYLWR